MSKAGLGNSKRKREVRIEASKQRKAGASSPEPRAPSSWKPSKLQEDILDALHIRGRLTIQQLCEHLGISSQKAGAQLPTLRSHQMIQRAGAHAYRLGPGSPQMKALRDGQSKDAPLLQELPTEGRVDLAQLSVRDKIQTWTILFHRAIQDAMQIDRVYETDRYREALRFAMEIDDRIVKLVRCEAEVNPGLDVDAVQLLVPGLNAPALAADGSEVSDEEVKRRQEVVLKLISSAVDEAKDQKKETP